MADTTTGFAVLPDIGLLEYNGATFSSLFKTSVSGVQVPDAAGRTVKYVEWTIYAEGTVTLGSFQPNISGQLAVLRRLLEQFGGTLTYKGKGLGNVVVNQPGGTLYDVAWGPKPKLLEFIPLGAGGPGSAGQLSAMVKWTVTTCIPEVPPQNSVNAGPGLGNVLQFNEETGVSYDDEDYSTITIRGTLEIPLTRYQGNIANRNLVQTADNYRSRYLELVADGFDLTRFRVTRRNFNVSRDKRTLEWDFVLEELPPMGLPPLATHARGTMSARSEANSPALMPYTISLKASYTIRKDEGRRYAWAAFVSLWKFRMEQSRNGVVPQENKKAPQDQQPVPNLPGAGEVIANPLAAGFKATRAIQTALLTSQIKAVQKNTPPPDGVIAIPMSFGFDEGLYLDSKVMTFEATWFLPVTFTSILVASGVWLPKEGAIGGGKLWASSVRDISGAKSWLRNALDPSQEVIVDFAGGQP
jgi:hypothetical protein